MKRYSFLKWLIPTTLVLLLIAVASIGQPGPKDVTKFKATGGPSTATRFCVYQIDKVTNPNNNNVPFSEGDVLCIDCPPAGQCPTKGGRTSMFQFVAADGTTLASGRWQNRYDARKGFQCGLCASDHANDPAPQTGYQFVP